MPPQMPPHKTADLDALRQIVARFRLSTLERLPVLDETFAVLNENMRAGKDWIGIDAFKQLRFQAHQLAGSSGSLGFPDLSKAASAFDLMLQGLLERQGPCRPSDWPQLRLLFRRMTAEIAALEQSDSLLFQILSRPSPPPSEETPPPEGTPATIVALSLEADQIVLLQRPLASFGIRLTLDSDAANEPPAQGEAFFVLADFSTFDDAAWRRLSFWRSHAVPILAVGWTATLRQRIEAYRHGASGCLRYPLDLLEIVAATTTPRFQRRNGGEKIVVVDDDPAMLQVTDFILHAAGMKVLSLEKPSQTLEVLERVRPDLLLIDRWMPEFSGIEIVAALRQQDVFAALPVIFLTGDDSDDGRRQAIDSGGDDHLAKPVDPDLLVSLVRNRVRRARILSQAVLRETARGTPESAAFLSALEKRLFSGDFSARQAVLAAFEIDLSLIESPLLEERLVLGLTLFLRRKLPHDACCGRLGGSRFALLATEASVPVRQQVRRLLHDAAKALEPLAKDLSTASYRLATIPFSDSMSASDWISAAKKALLAGEKGAESRHPFLSAAIPP